jgi:prepilin peptidase CpaA
VIESAYDWRWLLYALLAAAAATDIRSYRIPNALPLAVVAALLLAMFVSSAPAEDYAAAAGSGLIGLAVGYALFRFRLMGGGDGKLFAAAAAWFSVEALLGVGLFVSLAGIAVALAALLARTRRSVGAGAGAGGAMKAALKTRVPYGVAIAIGVVVASLVSAQG